MAKGNGIGKSTPIKITVGLLIIIGGFLVYVAYGVASHNAETTAVKLSVATLDKEGSKPAKANTINVTLMQKDISTIQSTQSTIQADVRGLRAEQQAGFKEILKRLPK